jgi:linoleoyl-CoA desaturase
MDENERVCKSESLAGLRQEIIARGWNRKATFRVISELLLDFAVAMAGIWIFVVHDDVLVRICAMILSTAGSMGVATNTHTSSHYATSRKRWVNELLTFLGYPVFVGLSACHWWHEHVVLHHPAPNVIGTDNDVDLGPWFARTREEVQRSSGMRRFYYEKLQWLVFPVAVAFTGFNMQKAGWTSLLGSLWRPSLRRNRQWIDLGAMVLHYVVWLAIPMAYFAPVHVLEFYVLRIALMGYAMFAVLAPGHFPAEAVCLKDDAEIRDYELLQTAATVNFRTGLVGSLMCSGLEYQIEHHLFPNISYVYYPKLAPLVREFCRRRGLPYRSYSWPVVIWKALRMLQSPPSVRADLEAFRVRPLSDCGVGT